MENKNKELEQFYDDQLAEIQSEQAKKLQKSKNKKKNLRTAIIAAILAVSSLFTAALLSKKHDNNKSNAPTTSTVTTEDDISLDDLGVKFEDPNLEQEKVEYGEVTGDINKEEIVEKDDTLWKDEEAANNSSNVGKEEIDDKEGTLEVKPNGDVFIKDEDYEIEKEDGTVIEGTITEEDKQNGEIGSNGTILPPGYVYDENLDKDVVEEDVNKFVYSDADYYDATGALIYSKGDLISKEDLEMAKQFLTTTKPVVETKPEQPQPEVKPEETTPIVDEGVVNPNGTYTIYGVTYMSKEDYQQFLLHPEQYGYYNGMVLSLEDIEALFNESQKSK